MKEPFSGRLDEEVMKKVKELAEKQDRSLNYIVNKLLKIALKGLEK